MKLVSNKQMQSLDSKAINDFGIPGIILMENAGRGTFRAIQEKFGCFKNKKISILVGPGNNGGDGLVIARHFFQTGAKPVIILLVPPEKLKGDAAINFTIAEALKIPLITIKTNKDLKLAQAMLKQSHALIDALFGTGLGRAPKGFFSDIIASINEFCGPVIAVDIPSGINGDTGIPFPAHVQADLTTTYGLAKPGLFLYPGSEKCGKLEIIEIGIPTAAIRDSKIKLNLIDNTLANSWLPQRPESSHKGIFGHVLIIAGSTGKSGAAILTARAALRSGAGLVTMAAPSSLVNIFESSVQEAMTLPLPDNKADFFIENDFDSIYQSISGKTAIILGPGLGTDSKTINLVKRLYQEINLPMVIDADALNILAQYKEILKTAPAARILTPHPGEMARLCKTDTKTIQADRLNQAKTFSKKNNIIMVLKGNQTIIAAPDGQAAINSTGNPGMATGGMGDVLAGLTGGLLAMKIPPWSAAGLGAYIHGLSADLLHNKHGSFGFTAGEVADNIPFAFTSLKNNI
jgi:ADP-dependent NAD(P)H-hydrate dehydratase / NAD(P)H-hydrate epimerase